MINQKKEVEKKQEKVKYFGIPAESLSKINSLTKSNAATYHVFLFLWEHFWKKNISCILFSIKEGAERHNKSERIIRSAVRYLKKGNIFKIEELSKNWFFIFVNEVSDEQMRETINSLPYIPADDFVIGKSLIDSRISFYIKGGKK